jgi:paraquat-inducible protein B
MSEPPINPPDSPPAARLRQQKFSFVWIIPIVAAIIASYLGYHTLAGRGPLLTISLNTAEGLEAGQTQVKYKNVALGTVESIDLATDNSHVDVDVRMNNVGGRFLTSHARFWVVRPRFSPNDFSGLTTLVSGAYIAVDPGLPGGTRQTKFAGLEQPPGALSDVPGRSYVLMADDRGPLTTGSPVFYRGFVVGEVLGTDLGNGLGPVKINIFVREPFDNLVRPDTHFWDSSGISAAVQGGVLQLQLTSLQAVFAGAISFSAPGASGQDTPSPDHASFKLYASQQAAQADTYATQVPMVSYLTSSVSGLTVGSPVDVLGIQVGDVTDVSLKIDPVAGTVMARVAMRLQPERVFAPGQLPAENPMIGFQRLVDNGMRVQVEPENLVTGQKEVSLIFIPSAKPAKVTLEDGAIVLPSQPGGIDQMLTSLGDISAKIDKMPLTQIGINANKLLETANGTLGSRSVKDSLASLNTTLQAATATLKTLNGSYGPDSDIERTLLSILQEAQGTLDSVKNLTDYLDKHPQSLLLGRGG